MPEKLRLMAYQAAVPATVDVAARDDHVRRLASELDRALSERPADIAVLPELSTLDYSRACFDCLSELAEERESLTVKGFARPIRNYTVVGHRDGAALQGRLVNHNREGLALAIDRDKLTEESASEAIRTLEEVLLQIRTSNPGNN